MKKMGGRDEGADLWEWHKRKGEGKEENRDSSTKPAAFFSSRSHSLLSPGDSRLRSTHRWVLLQHFPLYSLVHLLSCIFSVHTICCCWNWILEFTCNNRYSAIFRVLIFIYTYPVVLHWNGSFGCRLVEQIYSKVLLSSQRSPVCSSSVRRKGFKGGLRMNQLLLINQICFINPHLLHYLCVRTFFFMMLFICFCVCWFG